MMVWPCFFVTVLEIDGLTEKIQARQRRLASLSAEIALHRHRFEILLYVSGQHIDRHEGVVRLEGDCGRSITQSSNDKPTNLFKLLVNS